MFNYFSDFFSVIKNKYVQYLLWLLLIVIFYYTLLDLISIKEVVPDLFLILVIIITWKENRLQGMIAGFIIGLLLDTISMNVIGTNALAKTIAAFIASFICQNKNMKTYRFLIVVSISALIHNLIYFFFFINVSEQNFVLFYIQFSLASTAYTAFTAIFVALFNMSSEKIRFKP